MTYRWKEETFLRGFWSRVNQHERGCWLWTGATNPRYGVVTMRGQKTYAHRVSYELTHGPIPEGMVIDHTCHVTTCVNPSHLRLASLAQNQENLARLKQSTISGFRGVYWYSRSSKWVVRVQCRGLRYFGGYYTDVEEADKAAVALRNSLFTYNDADRIAA